LDIVFILDSSGSIEEDDPGNWDLLKSFIVDAAAQLGVSSDGAHVGLVQFSNNAELIFRLDECTDSDCVRNVVQDPARLKYIGGTTNIADGLRITRTQILGQAGDRPNVPNMVVLITDGEANEETASTIPEAQLLKQAVEHLYVVGITKQINEDELRLVSSDGSLFYADTFSDLTNILADVTTQLCVTNPPPTGTW
jgi:Mg-chelatase subunit ChlD